MRVLKNINAAVMINQRHSQFSQLLHRLRDFVGVEPNTGVNRRDLSCPNGCDIQLEFDLDRRTAPPKRVRDNRVPPPPRISDEWRL
jgi:hypothetical protein